MSVYIATWFLSFLEVCIMHSQRCQISDRDYKEPDAWQWSEHTRLQENSEYILCTLLSVQLPKKRAYAVTLYAHVCVSVFPTQLLNAVSTKFDKDRGVFESPTRFTKINSYAEGNLTSDLIERIIRPILIRPRRIYKMCDLCKSWNYL